MGGVKIVLKQKVENNNLVIELPTDSNKIPILDVLKKSNEKYGGYISIEIKPPYKPRTLKENAKYWAMCTEYGQFLGMSKEEVSDGIKVRAVEERGYPVDINRISKKATPRSIAKASTVEQSLLIEVLYQEASENGYIFDEQKVEETSERFEVEPKQESVFFENDNNYQGDIF